MSDQERIDAVRKALTTRGWRCRYTRGAYEAWAPGAGAPSRNIARIVVPNEVGANQFAEIMEEAERRVATMMVGPQERVARLRSTLSARGWLCIQMNRPWAFEIWKPEHDSDIDIMVPLDPAAGDFDRLMERAERRAAESSPVIDFAQLERLRSWSLATFGPDHLTGVVDHLREEVDEVTADPSDITEWADVLILAFDGAMRAGHEPEAILSAIKAKQSVNEARVWPDWRTVDPNKAIGHVEHGEEADRIKSVERELVKRGWRLLRETENFRMFEPGWAWIVSDYDEGMAALVVPRPGHPKFGQAMAEAEERAATACTAPRTAPGKPDDVPNGLCAERDDHVPHLVETGSLAPFWCTAIQEDRLPFAAERRAQARRLAAESILDRS